MLEYREVLFHIDKRILSSEFLDILDNLSSIEKRLYVVLKQSPQTNPQVNYFDSSNLAKILRCSISSIDRAKASLKKKGYARIIEFEDENKKPVLRVIVGKAQVSQYLNEN